MEQVKGRNLFQTYQVYLWASPSVFKPQTDLYVTFIRPIRPIFFTVVPHVAKKKKKSKFQNQCFFTLMTWIPLRKWTAMLDGEAMEIRKWSLRTMDTESTNSRGVKIWQVVYTSVTLADKTCCATPSVWPSSPEEDGRLRQNVEAQKHLKKILAWNNWIC